MWVGSGARVDGYGEARNEFVCRGQIDDRCYAKPVWNKEALNMETKTTTTTATRRFEYVGVS